MVSPNLRQNKETEEKISINDNTKKLFQVIYYDKQKKAAVDEDVPKISVSSLVSRLAFVYEKARNAVDYDEEHLLRKNAIARILKRQVVIEGVIRQVEAREVSTHLLTELIRGGYLPNDSIPETKIEEVAFIFEKYIILKNALSLELSTSFGFKTDISKTKDLIKEKSSLISWILTLAACEIEENLAPAKVKKTVVTSMYDFLLNKVKLPHDLLQYEEAKDIQIYLSIARNYLKYDKDIISFVLFKYYNGFWIDIGKNGGIDEHHREKIKKIAKNFVELKKEVDRQIKHPLTRQLDKITRTYSLCYNILTDAIEANPTELYHEMQKGEKSFSSSIVKVCNAKYNSAKAKLWRSAMRSIIYIFLTKSVFVFAVEVPAIRWFGEELHLIPLAINIAFPAALLLFIVLTTKKPGSDNTEKIVSGIKEIAISGRERTSNILLKRPRKRNLLSSIIFNLVYFSAFSVSLYFIVQVLLFINFTWVSILIFLFFLAFVSFFSVVTTKGVKDLMVVERRESLLALLLDLFYLPIIIAGRWLSNNMSKVNLFVFIFDFIIEAPFKIFVEIADDWTRYVKERRDNMD